jgi:hypothetical protein
VRSTSRQLLLQLVHARHLGFRGQPRAGAALSFSNVSGLPSPQQLEPRLRQRAPPSAEPQQAGRAPQLDASPSSPLHARAAAPGAGSPSVGLGHAPARKASNVVGQGGSPLPGAHETPPHAAALADGSGIRSLTLACGAPSRGQRMVSRAVTDSGARVMAGSGSLRR